VASATDTKLETLAINSIRMLSVDAVQKANSGHPGLPMGAATMGYVLWTEFLKHNPRDPHWQDRDRFVLSAGHGSALLYSLLYLTGYDVTIDDLMTGAVVARGEKRFRDRESNAVGEALPERPGGDFNPRRVAAFGVTRRF
jgi:transketolase N-terminal domain/subunit